jgi:plasmid stabilization system protein ParE
VKYKVVIAPPAVEDAVEAWRYIALDSHAAADRWYAGLLHAIDSLGAHPRRHRRARESASFAFEIRQMVYGSHRVLYTIVGHEVRVIHIRHAARRDLIPNEENG